MTPRIRDHVIRSAVLAAGVGAWQAFLHAEVFEHGRESLLHVARDSLLLWPLALAALAVGHRLARRVGGPRATAGALASALLLALMLIPAVGVHSLLDAPPPSGVHHPHMHRYTIDTSARGQMAHGIRDAAASLAAAVPLAFLGVALTRRSRRRSRASLGLAMLVLLTTVPGVAEPARRAFVPFTQPLPLPRVLTGRNITITMEQADLQILPGPKTRMWTYDGAFPGPTIRRPSGETTKVTFINELPTAAGSTTVHLHGAHSAASEDGQPHHDLIPVGGRRTYTYRFMEDGRPERAATHWYHDHTMDVTGRNVWMGLAGVQILDDAFDTSMPLPKGRFDVPLVLADRTFDKNNQLVVPTPTMIAAGERILVNGAVQPFFDVAARSYRFRIVNVSNLVEYRLGLSNGRDLVQIASETGLLPAPVRRSHIVVGPGERAEVVVDFSGLPGREVNLVNSAGPAGPAFLRGTPAEGISAPPVLMKFRVQRPAEDRTRIPARLRPVPDFGPPSVTRHWTLDAIPIAGLAHGSGEVDPAAPPASNVFGSMLWTINGLPFDPDRVDAKPELGATERWIFTNTSPTRHNVHIHDVDWHIVSRTGGATVFNEIDPDVRLGEAGLKENFVIAAGETVEVVSRFTDHVGRYVLHCHILPHEDAAMMAQFEVVRSDA